MGFQSEAKGAGIEPALILDALKELSGSATALYICIHDRDYTYQAMVDEVSRLRTLVGLVSSAFSVLALHDITQPRAPADANSQAD